MRTAIINGTLLLEDGILDGTLLFERDILEITLNKTPEADRVVDARGAFVAPGLVDVHIHGYLGEDASDGSEAGLARMAGGILENGVTSFLPTTMTLPRPQLEKALAAIRAMMQRSREASFPGARILGCHAEGPFINPRRKGAQAEEHIRPPDADFILSHRDVIRLVTVAPETPGGPDFIRAVAEAGGITLSLGHSSASFEQALEAFNSGVTHVTHLFNAMTGLHHREPGAVGAALISDVFCELIADGFHVHPGLFKLLHRAKGERLVLVTDCIRAGGLGDGRYSLGGQPVTVSGVECRLEDGTIAGSVLRLNEAARRFRDRAGVSMTEAVNAASIQPARAVGADGRVGSLAVGKAADVVILDGDFRVSTVFVDGVQKHKAGQKP